MKVKVKMKSEAILTVNVNEEEGVSVDARGQTSDGAVLNVLPEVPEGYVWREEVESVDDALSYEDLLFLFNTAADVEEQDGYNIKIGPFVQSFSGNVLCFDYVYFDINGNVNLDFRFKNRCCYINVQDFLQYGYEHIRARILSSLKIVDLRKLPGYVPEGIDAGFVSICQAIDKNIGRINDSFFSIAYLLHELKNCSWSNFSRYRCLDFYDFSKSRFGLGVTTTKNFLAIYDKFMIADGMNTPMLKEEFKDYGYSQLVELVPVESHLDEFSPSMTVKEIRKKKKELSSAGRVKADKIEQQHIDDFSPNINDVPDPVPVKTVPFEEVLSLLNGIINPYFEENKEKQSARCDAYRRAIEDVIAAFKAKYEE